MHLPRKILVPIDFSDASTYALDYAVDLARRIEAHITVIHAYEIPLVGFPDGALIASAEMASAVLNGAQTALDAAINTRKGLGVPLEGKLVQEDPWRAILKTTEEIGADLIIMGTHGRRGLPRALLGSVAEKVVRTATCPVLTIRGATDKK